MVPTLVRDKSGAVIYTLKASDFHLTDDGVEQPLHLEEDTGGEPLALVVLIESGGDGAGKLDEYSRLPLLVDNFVGAVPRRIAVVSFDKTPTVEQDFTSNDRAVDRAIRQIEAGDEHYNATLDALQFSVNMLRKQPLNYRRAILYVGETLDHGSSTTLSEAVRAVSDTNTAIYALAFNSTRAASKKEAAKTLGSGGIPLISTPGPVPAGPNKGCFSRDPNDPNVDMEQSRASQYFDCLSLLAPPLRLAKVAFLAAVAALEKNVPETVARLTGGEYYAFHNQKGLEQELETLANHVPNRYVLSFQPHAPHPGPHWLELKLPDYPQLHISARETYWAEAAETAK